LNHFAIFSYTIFNPVTYSQLQNHWVYIICSIVFSVIWSGMKLINGLIERFWVLPGKTLALQLQQEALNNFINITCFICHTSLHEFSFEQYGL